MASCPWPLAPTCVTAWPWPFGSFASFSLNLAGGYGMKTGRRRRRRCGMDGKTHGHTENIQIRVAVGRQKIYDQYLPGSASHHLPRQYTSMRRHYYSARWIRFCVVILLLLLLLRLHEYGVAVVSGCSAGVAGGVGTAIVVRYIQNKPFFHYQFIHQ